MLPSCFGCAVLTHPSAALPCPTPPPLTLLQEDSFHLVDNRPAKATKFGQRRFQQNRFQQQRREREAAREAREKREAGGKQQQQKKNPWQNQHWREQQRVSRLGLLGCVILDGGTAPCQTAAGGWVRCRWVAGCVRQAAAADAEVMAKPALT